MRWKQRLYVTVSKYIYRDIAPQYINLVDAWWKQYASEILNEFEFTLDEENDKGRRQELVSLRVALELDANIDNKDKNVERIYFVIDSFIKELEQEVDYTNPSREDLERMEETS